MIPRHPLSILVIGSGGREHALCWKLAQSSSVETVYCAPGNGGTAGASKVSNVDISVMDFPAIIEFAKGHQIDLTVIGPDNPLAEGIVDVMERENLRVFGPRRESARLEWSKAFAKKFMSRFGIPTARYLICESFTEAQDAVHRNSWARVIKADGLALGKGVFVCENEEEAHQALTIIFEQKTFGQAGSKVVIEERLDGDELSLLVLCDGTNLVPLLPSRDHKRRFDGNKGPNTGGMGAYAPVEIDDRIMALIDTTVLEPIRAALKSGEFFYKGVLFIGLMMGSQEDSLSDEPDMVPYVLEFNARFGDPETQAILPLMTSDLLDVLWACTEGNLADVPITWSGQSSCCVVAAGNTYPESSSKNEKIQIGLLAEDTIVFHAGTKLSGKQLLTNGGRILAVTGVGPSLDEARSRAYESLKAIIFNGIAYRTDIAKNRVVSCP